jgi:hypothetical protein
MLKGTSFANMNMMHDDTRPHFTYDRKTQTDAETQHYVDAFVHISDDEKAAYALLDKHNSVYIYIYIYPQSH